ncbi:hypothetical protein COLO4_24328 [Corchorus olitorius]|uniref:RNase H type-1 domain-containing protein n=1 Tax=Corchorus olitorius TaxID=93759 RepID=A0A1R3IB07_9ROSI|nr:hypothetical protein COLO4_24328 [Corchorus olitorius]
MGIREDFITFSVSKWCDSHNLIVESDSENAVVWAINSSKVPWNLRNFSFHLDTLKRSVTLWSFTKIPREQSDVVDSLARAGVSRANGFTACLR